MSDPRADLVLGDRRLTRDRALIMAVIDGAEGPREAISGAVDDGADLVDIGGLDGDEIVSTVAWARETYPGLAISVRTERGEVAERARLAGADVLNDGWHTADPGVLDAATRHGSGYIGVPGPGQTARDGTLVRVAADAAGLAQLGEMADAGWQVLADVADPTLDGLPEVLAASTLAARAGAAVLRTRHVRATRHAAEMVASILGTRPQSRPERWLA